MRLDLLTYLPKNLTSYMNAPEYQLPYGWKKVVRRVPNNHIWDVYVYGHNGSNEKPYRICSFPPVVKIMIQEYIHIKSMNDNRNYFF